MLGKINLQGLSHFRELDLGAGFRVIVLSKERSGGLALFSPAGLLEDSIASNKITWIQLFDLNGDGVSELVTEEIEGSGTGVLFKNFKVYMVGAAGIKKLWERRSYSRESTWTSGGAAQKIQEARYFLRFDGSAAGFPGRMTYLEPVDKAGRYRESVFAMTGSSMKQVLAGQAQP
jgi:hypothetical protein